MYVQQCNGNLSCPISFSYVNILSCHAIRFFNTYIVLLVSPACVLLWLVEYIVLSLDQSFTSIYTHARFQFHTKPTEKSIHLCWIKVGGPILNFDCSMHCHILQNFQFLIAWIHNSLFVVDQHDNELLCFSTLTHTLIPIAAHTPLFKWCNRTRRDRYHNSLALSIPCFQTHYSSLFKGILFAIRKLRQEKTTCRTA